MSILYPDQKLITYLVFERLLILVGVVTFTLVKGINATALRFGVVIFNVNAKLY